MIPPRLLQLLACGTVAFGFSSCGMFSQKTAHIAPAGQQEFDPYSNTWRPSGQVVTPPPSQPNAQLAEREAEARREDSALNKAGRAMSNTAGAMGRAVKKPLDWLPFGKKDEPAVEGAAPMPPAATAAQ